MIHVLAGAIVSEAEGLWTSDIRNGVSREETAGAFLYNKGSPCSTSLGQKPATLHTFSGTRVPVALAPGRPTELAPPRTGLRCASYSSAPSPKGARHMSLGSRVVPAPAVRSGLMNLTACDDALPPKLASALFFF